MGKRAKLYQGFHTHPSQDSSSKVLDDGTILVSHRIDKREGLIITQLARTSMTASELCDKLNLVFPNGGYGLNHVQHALKRLRNDGVVSLDGHTWSLLPKGKARWESITKRVRTFRGGK